MQPAGTFADGGLRDSLDDVHSSHVGEVGRLLPPAEAGVRRPRVNTLGVVLSYCAERGVGDARNRESRWPARLRYPSVAARWAQNPRSSRTARLGYPVAIDNDYEIGSAFANHYWPALYFVDADGIIRDQHFGEGRYEQSERVIQRLLGAERELVSVEALGVEAEADWDHLQTPETYLGHGRGGRFASPEGGAFDERRAYELPERLPLNQWALAGEWTIGRENVVLDDAGGSIAYRFHARDAHLVLSPGARGPIP